MRDVSLSDIRIERRRGGGAEPAEREIPDIPAGYPEALMFGELPAYRFYCRHADDSVFHNVRVRAEQDEGRLAFRFDDCRNISHE